MNLPPPGASRRQDEMVPPMTVLDAFTAFVNAVRLRSDGDATSILEAISEAVREAEIHPELAPWVEFLRRHGQRIARGSPAAPLQLALAEESDAAVHRAAAEWVGRHGWPGAWLRPLGDGCGESMLYPIVQFEGVKAWAVHPDGEQI